MDSKTQHSLALTAAKARLLLMRAVFRAGCGHPGGSLSACDALSVLYFHKMRIDPKHPQDPERDRFVLSKGHGAPALYAILSLRGYFPEEEVLGFRQIGSRLSGHPDMKKTPGVDLNTGSLGQGVAVATGMAIAAKHLKKNYHVYAVVGDGEIQEGLVWEAAMAAAHYKLDNLTVILDHNGLQIDGTNDEVMSLGDPVEKYKAFGLSASRSTVMTSTL